MKNWILENREMGHADSEYRVTLAFLPPKNSHSQNLGHLGMLTTLTSYGTVDTYRQDDVIRQLANLPV